MSFDTALNTYGSDKPDLRFELPIVDVIDIAEKSDFKVFKDVINRKGIVRCINAKGGEKLSRKKH